MGVSGDLQDNPVGINVVPMVDVIFCLCVFFMCSFRFKEREGRLETWLPKQLGSAGDLAVEPREWRVALFWDDASGRVSRRFGARPADDDEEFEALLRASRDDEVRLGRDDATLIVDADPRVPWSAVLEVFNVGTRLAIDPIQLARAGEHSR